MKNVAIRPTSPLYKQLLNMELKPHGKKAIADFFDSYLVVLPDDELADYILRVTSGISYNLQIIGSGLEELKERKISRKTIDASVKYMLEREGELHFKDYIHMMQPTGIKIIKAMASEEFSSPSLISKK